ncbi:MAG: hypothetical protein Q9210_001826 [Variospora velana]
MKLNDRQASCGFAFRPQDGYMDIQPDTHTSDPNESIGENSTDPLNNDTAGRERLVGLSHHGSTRMGRTVNLSHDINIAEWLTPPSRTNLPPKDFGAAKEVLKQLAPILVYYHCALTDPAIPISRSECAIVHARLSHLENVYRDGVAKVRWWESVKEKKLNMPQMAGYSVVREMLRLDETSERPVWTEAER